MRRQQTSTLKDLVNQFIREEGLEEGLYNTRLYALWDEMLGQTVARHTTKKYVKNHILYVQFDSSVVRSQLFAMRDDIVAQLNKRIGKELIHSIELR
jgi:predicted nucleic acid-binding Zn ribbon protein